MNDTPSEQDLLDTVPYELRLYVAGQTAKSLAAFANLKRICETHLNGQYRIEVIDLIKTPQLAAGDQIFAVPTLVRRLPEPIKKIIGDLSNEERVLVGLDVQPIEETIMIDDKNPEQTHQEAIEAAAADQPNAHYLLKLYITGTTPRATKALVNIRKLCEEHLSGRYDLEIIDISQHPTLAEGEQIIAAPTLIKKLPLPLRRFIGDMSQTERILLGLDLRKL